MWSSSNLDSYQDAEASRAGEAVAAANWLAALRAYLLATATLNLLWETAQLPLYEIGRTGTMGEKASAVVH